MTMQRLRRALLAAGCAVSLGCGRVSDASQDPIYIGIVFPTPRPGQVTTRMGADLALKEINAAGGINGHPLAFVAKNDENDPNRAIRVASELVADERVMVVIGHVSDPATVAAAPVYAQGGVPVVTPTASGAQLEKYGRSVFRLTSSDSSFVEHLATRAVRHGRRVGILYLNSEGSRESAYQFTRRVAAQGGAVVAADPYLPRVEDMDLGAYAANMKQRGVQVVYFITGENTAAEMMDSARAIGFNPRYLGEPALEGLSALGSAYDGVEVQLGFHPSASPEAAKFTELFRREYGSEPDSYPARGYDAVHLAARALREVGTDRERLRQHISAVGRPGGPAPVQGAAGLIRFNARGEVEGQKFMLGVLRDGKFEVL